MAARSTEPSPSKKLPTEAIADSEVSAQNPSATLAAAAAFVREPFRTASRPGVVELLRLSWPVMLSQFLVTTVALADIAMVGRLGPKALASVGYATQFFFMTQSALFAVGFACVALMARAIGGDDAAGARAALGGSLWVGVVTATLVCGAALVVPRTILGWLNAEPEVIEQTVPYMRLVLGSTLVLAASLVLENGLRADRDTFTPMLVAWVVAAAKISLSAILIFGLLGFPRLELLGAGIATVISQILGLTAFATVVLSRPKTSPVAVRWRDVIAGLRLFRTIVKVAAPGVAERMVLNLALLSYFAVLGGYGTVVVAAYTLGVRAISFSWIPGTAFGAAAATLVGQALGRGDEGEAEAVGRRAVSVAFVTATVLGLLAIPLVDLVAGTLTTDEATSTVLAPLLLAIAVAQPMLQTHFTLAGVFRGAGDNWTPLVSAAIGNWGVRVPLALLCAYVLKTGVNWVWAVLVLDHVARVTCLQVAFRKGSWLRKLPMSRGGATA